MCSYTTPNGHWTPPESDMFPFHRCAMGAEHCCCKNAAEIHAEVINSDVRPSFSHQPKKVAFARNTMPRRDTPGLRPVAASAYNVAF